MSNTPPRFAYHGTTKRIAEAALLGGLKPRLLTGAKGNWDEHPSIESHVYLSTLYAPYFALIACKDGDEPAILEIDLAQLNTRQLMPDEDYIEQAHREFRDHWPQDTPTPPEGDMQTRMDFIRPRIHEWQYMWASSALIMGNLAHHGPIPPSAITRAVACTDTKAAKPVVSMALDPSISIINARYLGDKYAALTQWWIGESRTASDVDPLCNPDQFPPGTPQNEAMIQHLKERHLILTKTLAERPGMETL